jgi:hypothetical protein
LKAWSEAAVWPLRPREVDTFAQSSLRAALRCGAIVSSQLKSTRRV